MAYFKCIFFILVCIQHCHAQLISVGSEIENIKAELASLKSELQLQFLELQEENANLRLQLENVTQALHHSKHNAGQVAFSAYMTTGIYQPQPGDTLPFNGILINKGDHYDNTTSIFTCPASGTYMFTYSIYSYSLDGSSDYFSSGAQLVRSDGVELAEAYCGNYVTGDIVMQCGNTVIAQCGQSQQVECKYVWSYGQMYGSSEHRTSSFSGFLLSAD